MERYKKRTIALCLASLLTVVGAFGSEHYENSLMALKINNGNGGYVNITAYTKKSYNQKINVEKKGAGTYIIKLKGTDSTATEPSIEGFSNIESIKISTFPYTPEENGYTNIIIKTKGASVVNAQSALFIPGKTLNTPPKIQNKETKVEKSYWDDTNYNKTENKTSSNVKTNPQPITPKPVVNNPENNVENDKVFIPPAYTNENTQSSSSEQRIVILCISILFTIIGLVFMFSKDRMASVVGNQGEYDLDEKSKKKNKKQLKSTINTLDKKYKTTKYNNSTDTILPEEEFKLEAENIEDPQNVVDLDTLYQEKTQTVKSEENEEIDDLADLMREFTLEETEHQEEEPLFDEELFNKIITNKNIKFTKADIDKINELTQIEIGDETINYLTEIYNNRPKPAPTKNEILEDLLLTYSIKQNILFSNDDVKTIKKLMDVELDPQFVTDFTTNPAKTIKMEKEIEEQKSPKKSEILTLNVKDLLPNLSQELKKHGKKQIETEVKPQVVYFSEGYEYDKLKVSDDLSNIYKSGKHNKNEYQPSYKAPVVEAGYNISTLSIKDELPNMADVKANPKKYEDKPVKKQKADEKALLKSLSNVTFKPFYEDSDETKSDNFITIDTNNDNIINPTQENDKIIDRVKCNQVAELILKEEANGYTIIGILNNKEFDLKHYNSLTQKKIQVRNPDKDNNTQYLIRLGIHKFIVNITSDNMEFVMDLC